MTKSVMSDNSDGFFWPVQRSIEGECGKIAAIDARA
jgi:hypothetical protein